MEEESRKERILRKLKNKYRLVLINDSNFEERFSFRLSRLNVFIVGSAAVIFIFLLTFLIISNTGLRFMIKGVADIGTQRQLYENQLKLDSQALKLKQYELWTKNVQLIMDGENIEDPKTHIPENADVNYDTIKLRKSKEDSILRAEYSEADQYALTQSTADRSGFIFFTPLKGTVLNAFNPNKGHFGVDISSKKNEAIKACLEGTVILATWSVETGYSIAVQHTDNLISVYKHTSALLKKQGDYIKSGEAIAIYGNSGELSSGPHLHFELWYNGNPVNPEEYIVFE